MDPQTAHGLLVMAQVTGICLGFAATFLAPIFYFGIRGQN